MWGVRKIEEVKDDSFLSNLGAEGTVLRRKRLKEKLDVVGIDQGFSLHHVRFQMPISHLIRDDDSAILYEVQS